jgi:hypothetical protein
LVHFLIGGVDKYGRIISKTYDEDELRRFYRLQNEDRGNGAPDYARGEVLLESSDEEDRPDEDDDSDLEGVVTIGRHPSQPISVLRDSDAEVNLDETHFADLDAQAVAFSKAHPEAPQQHATRTRRLAAVNLDWDHVRASHVYKICSSLVSPTVPVSFKTSLDGQSFATCVSNNKVMGRVVSVCIYPSEFGKERMAREEKEGPPPEIFQRKSNSGAEEEINVQNIYDVGDVNDYDEDALRNYQLERLRYANYDDI